MFRKLAACLVVSMAFAALPALAQPAKPAPAAVAPAAEDKYVGYYYPKPTTVENYASPMQTIAGADAERAQPARDPRDLGVELGIGELARRAALDQDCKGAIAKATD